MNGTSKLVILRFVHTMVLMHRAPTTTKRLDVTCVLFGSSRRSVSGMRVVVVIDRSHVELSFCFLLSQICFKAQGTMSEILMMEMESMTVSPVKPEERVEETRSFLLVDEQEKLKVKLCSRAANS